MNDDQQFENRLRKALESMADAAPEPHPYPDHLLISDSDEPAIPRSDYGPNRPLAIAAVFLAVSIGVGLWAARTNTDQITADSGVTVQHELVRYSQSFDLTCPEGEPEFTGEFNTMEIESWGSQDLGLWRQVVRYPDGTQREMIATDNPWAPTVLYTGGTAKGLEIACPGLGTIHHEPNKHLWFSLNPMAEPPPLNGWGAPLTPWQSDLTELIDDASTGPNGQIVQRWRHVRGPGFASGADEVLGHLSQEWLVDPDSGQIVQIAASHSYESTGDVRWIASLVLLESTTVDAVIFNTNGLAPLP